MNLNLKTKPSYDDEEIFDNPSFRSQYRFETTEDDLMANDQSEIIALNRHYELMGDLDPE